MTTYSLEKKVWFPIPQGQNWVQVIGAGLDFDPVEATATTSSGAGGPVILGVFDRTTLTRDGGLCNLTGATLDGNQVLVATFYGEPPPCAPLPPPPTPKHPDYFISLCDLQTELQPILWPIGEAANLVEAHKNFFGEALTQLQIYAKPLQENNLSIWQFCSTLFECGMTVIDTPFNGIIRRVSSYDRINEQTGLEDPTQYPNWCSEVHYVNVDYRMLRKYVDKNLAYLGFPAGNFGCGCGVLLPAISPLIQIFQQFAWCGKQPIQPYTPPDQTGMPPLPQGFMFPNSSSDGPRRARIGMWAQHRGRIYMAPWIQSTETVVIEWDGIRFKWCPTDLTENNNLLKQAVKFYVWWQHYRAGYDDNPALMQEYMQGWMDARAELLYWYRTITRRRMIEESFARAAQGSLIQEGMTTSSTSTTTSTSSTSTSSTTLSTTTVSTSSTTTTTLSTSSTSSTSTSSSSSTTNSTSSSTTTTLSSTTTAGNVFLAALTVTGRNQTFTFGNFPPGHYRVYYEAGMVGVIAGTDGGGPYYGCGLNYAAGNLPPVQPVTFEGFYLYYMAGTTSVVVVAGPEQGEYTQYSPAHVGNIGELNTQLAAVQSHFSGDYVDFTTTVTGAISMSYSWGDNDFPGTTFYPAGVTFNLYQVYP